MNTLRGKRVVVTRPQDQSRAFVDALEQRGAEPVLFPTIAIELVEPSARLDAALRNLSDYAWVVFTSANGVRAVLDRRARVSDARWPRGVLVAAVGSVTAAALAARGIHVDAVPHEYRGDAVPETMGDLRGRRVLLPRAEAGRPAIVQGLRRGGAHIHDLPVYRTVAAKPDAAALAQLRQGADVVTFTSPSTLDHFLALLGDEGRRLLASAVVATIGPVTTEAARTAGVRVDVQPDVYTVDAMLEALERHAAVTA